MRTSGPVLAVLPSGTGGTDSGDLIAQGFVEDLSGQFARFSAIEVIAPMSAIASAGRPETEVAAELGASHILRARLRRNDDRLRLSAALIDGQNGTQLWDERLETPSGDLFALQDEIVARVAATFSARLENDLLREARAKPTESLTAYELTLRGWALLREGSFESDEQARAMFNRALDLDPHYARAHAGLSLSWFNEWSCQFWEDFETNGRRAYEHAHRALELDDRDAMLHHVIGRILLYRRDFERAAWYFDRALALCPNDAELLIQLTLSEVFLGRPEAGIAHAEKAMRLNPYHPNFYYCYAALPHFVLRDFATALEMADKSAGVPIIDIPACSAIASAYLGRWSEAHRLFAIYNDEFRKRITRGREPLPGESCRWLLEVNPFRREEDIDLIVEGFRMLGAGCAVDGLPAAEEHAAESAQNAALRRNGETWEIEFGGERAVVPDLKGLRDLRRLLARPGEEIHCLDLAERDDAGYAGTPVLDEKARQDIKARIRALQEDLGEAEDMNDLGRAEKIRQELDSLVHELSRALGLHGRGRTLGSLAERARSTVTWRIRHAIRKIESRHPLVGRHLSNAVRTGTFCRYLPERPVQWEISE